MLFRSELHLVADGVGELLPAVPVVLGQAVLDAADRVLADPFLPDADHIIRRENFLGVETPSPAKKTLAAEHFVNAGNTTVKPVKIKLIPYYAWANRGKTDMTVWMPLIR